MQRKGVSKGRSLPPVTIPVHRYWTNCRKRYSSYIKPRRHCTMTTGNFEHPYAHLLCSVFISRLSVILTVNGVSLFKLVVGFAGNSHWSSCHSQDGRRNRKPRNSPTGVAQCGAGLTAQSGAECVGPLQPFQSKYFQGSWIQAQNVKQQGYAVGCCTLYFSGFF